MYLIGVVTKANTSVIHFFDPLGKDFDDLVIENGIITDIEIKENQLYIINFKSVLFFVYTDDIELVAVIDASYTEDWPIPGSWEPV